MCNSTISLRRFHKSGSRASDPLSHLLKLTEPGGQSRETRRCLYVLAPFSAFPPSSGKRPSCLSTWAGHKTQADPVTRPHPPGKMGAEHGTEQNQTDPVLPTLQLNIFVPCKSTVIPTAFHK